MDHKYVILPVFLFYFLDSFYIFNALFNSKNIYQVLYIRKEVWNGSFTLQCSGFHFSFTLHNLCFFFGKDWDMNTYDLIVLRFAYLERLGKIKNWESLLIQHIHNALSTFKWKIIFNGELFFIYSNYFFKISEQSFMSLIWNQHVNVVMIVFQRNWKRESATVWKNEI